MRAIVRLLGISPVSFTPVAGSIVIATSIATAQWASSAGRSRAFVHTEGCQHTLKTLTSIKYLEPSLGA